MVVRNKEARGRAYSPPHPEILQSFHSFRMTGCSYFFFEGGGGDGGGATVASSTNLNMRVKPPGVLKL